MESENFFPESERFFYRNAPLKQVVCQFRFPTLLRLEKDVPSDFQERIAFFFPLFEKSEMFPFSLPIPNAALAGLGQVRGPVTYKFIREDKASAVEINSSSLTISTTAYERWEIFLQMITLCITQFTEIYKPTFYERVGLRYVDVINKVKLGLGGCAWAELLNPAIAGELCNEFIGRNTESKQTTLRVNDSKSNGGFLLQHGLGMSPGESEVIYYIDFDFYKSKHVKKEDVDECLEHLHRNAGSAWRWCISQRLHEALQPYSI